MVVEVVVVEVVVVEVVFLSQDATSLVVPTCLIWCRDYYFNL